MPDAVVDVVAAALVSSVHVRDGVTSNDARELLLAAGFSAATAVNAVRRRLPVRACVRPVVVEVWVVAGVHAVLRRALSCVQCQPWGGGGRLVRACVG